MRIISLSPSITETLQALGLHENIAGVTSECPQKLVKSVLLGAPNALNLETILETAPDLVFCERGVNRPAEIQRLKEKLRVVEFSVTSLPQLISVISEIGNLTARELQAKELIREIYQEWAPPSRRPVRTAILIWNNPVTSVSSRSYLSQLVEAAGGVNLYREDPVPEVAIELEELLDLEPEVLLLASHPFSFDAESAAAFRNFPQLHQKKVELVDGLLFSRFGPRTIQALQHLKKIFEPLRNSNAG